MMTTDVMSKAPNKDDFYNWNSLHFPHYIHFDFEQSINTLTTY